MFPIAARPDALNDWAMGRGFMGWGVCGLALALALAGCKRGGSDRDPLAESRTPPGLSGRFFAPEGWAWGFLQLGDGPVQRYGVSAPATTPRADILILPDYGETAETWFETARDLNARGYTVWVLEAQGQGGSERTASPRDLGHVRSFDGDVAAVRAMSRAVIRTGKPLVIVGQGVGAVIAARALEQGVAAGGLVVSAPAWRSRPQDPSAPLWGFGMGGRRAAGGAAWSRRTAFDAGATHDPWRGAVTATWQVANPDLRMGGPSIDWISAFNQTTSAAKRDLGRIGAPTLVLESAGAQGCLRLTDCRAQAWPQAGASLELERDAVRAAWLDAIDAFVQARLRPTPDT